MDALYEARRLLELSCAIDPNYARTYALLASAYEPAWVNPLDSDYLNPSVLDRAPNVLARPLSSIKICPWLMPSSDMFSCGSASKTRR